MFRDAEVARRATPFRPRRIKRILPPTQPVRVPIPIASVEAEQSPEGSARLDDPALTLSSEAHNKSDDPTTYQQSVTRPLRIKRVAKIEIPIYDNIFGINYPNRYGLSYNQSIGLH